MVFSGDGLWHLIDTRLSVHVREKEAVKSDHTIFGDRLLLKSIYNKPTT